jgi:hypothetical protein
MGFRMKIRKPLILSLAVVSVLIPFILFAEKGDFMLLKDIVKQNMNFLNDEQDKDRVKQIGFSYPIKKTVVVKHQSKKKTEIKTYDFSQKTAYGSFTVNVIEKENLFNVSFASESPIQTYKLVDSRNKNTTKKEDIGELTAYTFTINKPFEPYYILILTMVADGITSQNIVPLYTKTQVKTKQVN